ncbi:VCBS domain-containing protein [Vibrio maritimus]|uniref:VCBS domain-containing protein n=1 Tax=Vibrio maritimus TaxID=990268 RepID=UPI002DD44A3B|nr:VCBS domain-containing protein [Vibrio maritimus]
MSVFTLHGLAQVSGTLVVDANGQLVVLPLGADPRPGDVVIRVLDNEEVGDDINIELVQEDGSVEDIELDADAEAIIAQIEGGEDPTQNEEQATAAGQISGSSLTLTGAVARDGEEVIAATQFDTSALEAQGLTTTQSLTLLQFLTNTNPTITSDELIGFSVESGNNQDGSTFDGTPSLSGQLSASDVEFAADTLTWEVLSSPENLSDYGTFTLDSDGQWSFELSNDSEAVDALNVDDVVPLVFNVQVTDPLSGSTQQQIVITISGTNDKPIISEESALSGLVEEAGHLDDGTPTEGISQVSGQVAATDVDSEPESLTWSLSGDADTTYGEFSITEQGVWTYKLANSGEEFSDAQRAAVDALKEGEVIPLTFKVKVTDDQGVSVEETVTVTINGTNDVPVLDANLPVSGDVRESGSFDDGTEDVGVPTASGQLSATDVDSSTLTWSTVGDVSNSYGTFSITENGLWTFTLDNAAAAVEGLNEGDEIPLTFTVQVEDEQGGTVSQQVSIVINGTNDAPVITGGDYSGEVEEAGADTEGTGTATGQIIASDVDSAQGALNYAISGSSPFGDIEIDENGQWTFTLDNSADVTQSLNNGDSEVVEYTVIVTDDFGAIDEQTISITIQGTNDAPVLDSDLPISGDVRESGSFDDGSEDVSAPSASGQLSATDVDSSTLTWSAVGDVSNSYGTFSITDSGLWTFTLDNEAAAVDGLNEGDEIPLTFTVQVEDEQGATVSQQISIVINGTNDAPVITGEDFSGEVKEAGAKTEGTNTATGQIIATDVDSAQGALQYAINGSSPFGDIEIDEDGQWTFTLDNSADVTQSLDKGDVEVVEYTVVVTDDFGAVDEQTISITIKGTNDAPDITGGKFAGTVKEAGANTEGKDTVTGRVVAKDVDDTQDELTYSVKGNSPYGELTIDEDGNWTFELDNDAKATQALDSGDEVTALFTVVVKDDNGAKDEQVISIDIKGTNDAPDIVRGKFTGTVKEAGANTEGKDTVTGRVVAKDVDDTQDELTYSVKGNSPYGELTIDEDGNWTFELDNDAKATQALDSGDEVTALFTVVVKDDNGAKDEQVISIDIKGTNDAPDIVRGKFSGTVKEAGANTEGKDTVTGRVVAKDVDDTQDELTYSVKGNSPYGELTIDEDGNWTFELDNDAKATQALDSGDEVTALFTVVVKDDNGAKDEQVISIDIKGTNDAPDIVRGKFTGTVKEAGANTEGKDTVTGRVVAKDVDDTQDELTYSVKGNSPYGDLTIDEDGNWTFELDNDAKATQALDSGDEVTALFTVVVKDDNGAKDEQVISIDIKGTNDAPDIVRGKFSGTVKEAGENTEGKDTVTGRVVAKDVDDTQDELTYSVKGNSPYGELTIDEDGNWTFELDNDAKATQALDSGDEVTALFTVVVKDDNGAKDEQVISIDIKGTNDAPDIVRGKFSGTVKEAGANTEGKDTVTGRVVAKDVDDTHDELTYSVKGNSPYGDLTIDEDGNWTFELDNDAKATQALDNGDEVTALFTVVVKDDNGAKDEQVISIDIKGTNDAPDIVRGKFTGTVKEAGANTEGKDTVTGRVVAKDVDDTQDDLIYSVKGNSPYGELSIDEDGNWTFELDNDAKATQALDSGDEVTALFTVVVKDDNGAKDEQVISIDIKGTNDAPDIVRGKFSGTVKEAGANTEGKDTVTGRVVAKDVDDTQDELTYSVKGNSPYGDLTIDEDGNWTFELDNDAKATQKLDNGDLETAVFTVVVKDDNGVKDEQVISIDIKGTNDAPDIVRGKFTGEVTEAGTNSAGRDTVSGRIVAKDIDDTKEQLEYSIQGSSPLGELTINDAGKWTFTLDNEAANYLGEGDVETIQYTVIVTDDNGATDEQVITIDVKGTNDDPIIDLDGSADGTGYSALFTEGDEPIMVVDNDLVVTDDVDLISKAEIKLTNPQLNDALTHVGTLPNGLSVSTATVGGAIVLTISGQGSAEDYELALKQIQFNNTSEDPNDIDRVIEISVFDDQNVESNVATSTITVVPVNDLPESEDFSFVINDNDPTPVVFDSGAAPIDGVDSGVGDDHISDVEDDINNQQVLVTITELPTGGKLFYDGDEITQAHVENGDTFDPTKITYEPSEEAQGFILGSKVIPTESDLESSREEFYNWGNEVDGKNRVLELANGDEITISSNKGKLTQYRGDVQDNHVGHGLGIGGGQGINEGEQLTIDFSSRPATHVELGLDGMGGYFYSGLDNDNESAVTIEVMLSDGSTVEYVPDFQKDSSGNNELFHALSFSVEDLSGVDEGVLITGISVGTSGPGNWELRYLDTALNDSFKYKAVDSDEALSEESVVTIIDERDNNAAPTLDLDLSADGTGFDTLFTEGDAPINVVDDDITIFDENNVIGSAEILFTNPKDGDTFEVASLQDGDFLLSGLQYGYEVIDEGLPTESIKITLTGEATPADYEAAIQLIKFENSSQNPDQTSRVIEITTFDDKSLPSNTAVSTIDVSSVADVVVSPAEGDEDTNIDLAIVLPAGSDVSKVVISGIPSGAKLFDDGTELTFTGDSIEVLPSQLAKLSILPPENSDEDFVLAVDGVGSGGASVEMHDLSVTVKPVTDMPTLTVSGEQILSAINFENVDLGNRSWKGNIDGTQLSVDTSDELNLGDWGVITDRGEVGKERVYMGSGGDNQIFEIEGRRGQTDSLFTEFDGEAGQFYELNFDAAARRNDSPMDIILTKETSPGVWEDVEVLRSYSNGGEHELDVRQWSRDEQVFFQIPDDGSYRVVFESPEQNSYGALLDNITLSATENVGYEDSLIDLSDISAALTDVDGSESLTLQLSGLPDGATLWLDGSELTVTGGVVELPTDVSLENLQVVVADPNTYTLTVTATSSEGDTEHPVADKSVVKTINLIVLDVNEANNTPPEVVDFDVFAGDDTIPLHFADFATDIEDDANSDKDTLVEITELPQYGELYVEVNNGDGRLYLEVGDTVLDKTVIQYELNNGFSANEDGFDPSLSALLEQSIEITGGIYTGARPDPDSISAEQLANIAYDDNGNDKHSGFFTQQTGQNGQDNENGNGRNTDEGEYIAVRYTAGSMTHAKVTLASLTGNIVQGNGNAQAAVITAFLYLNGAYVGAQQLDPDTDLHPASGNSSKVATMDIQSEQPFDEVRVVLTNENGKGFVLQGFEAVDTDVTDSFKYEAVDDDGARSSSDATVTINISPEGNFTDSNNDEDYDFAAKGTETSYLYGTEGDDLLIGGDGDDLLIGGKGSDTLTGGEGNDTFKWTESDLDGHRDVITDFSRENGNNDVIDLKDLFEETDSLDDLLADNTIVVSEDNGSTLINVDKGNGKSVTIELEGVVGVDNNMLNNILIIQDS